MNPDGTWSMIANLSAWLQSHPAANPDPEDFEPDGTWYSMLSAKGYLYAMESNHQQIVRVDVSTGAITQVTDLSVTYPGETNWFGPTAAAYHGNFYIGNLGEFPIRGGASKIIKMTPDGTLKDWATGLECTYWKIQLVQRSLPSLHRVLEQSSELIPMETEQ